MKEEALKWWNGLHWFKKADVKNRTFPELVERGYLSLTESEIEEIYRREHPYGKRGLNQPSLSDEEKAGVIREIFNEAFNYQTFPDNAALASIYNKYFLNK